jgi:hypothetical protein
MGLREWLRDKSKGKQGKNVAQAASQAVSSLRTAMAVIIERGGTFEAAVQSPVVKQTLDRHADRIASFSGGPMDAEELWDEVYQQLITANESMLDPDFAAVVNGMLQDAHRRTVEQGIVRSNDNT